MNNKKRNYLIIGIVFLAVGMVMLLTESVSRPIVYGDFVIGCAFLALSAKEK